MSDRKIIPAFDLYKTLDSKQGFEFSLLEESYNPYDASLPHRHNYYEILYFREGGGIHEIDFHSYPVRKNSLHFISPEQVHLLRRDRGVTGYVISFTPDFYLGKDAGISFIEDFPFFDNPYAVPIVTMQENDEQRRLMEIISNLQTEYSSSHHDKSSMLLSYLTILLIAARRLYAWGLPSTVKPAIQRSELVSAFKREIVKNYTRQKSVAYYAELLNISAGHLSETVQKDTGKTAGNMIHDLIILEAKRLLYHSPKSVKEVAYELGYEDPSYFSRFFKTHTQMTPEVFRNHIREKYH